MKFGKQLALRSANDAQWQPRFLNYKMLKQFIREQSLSLAAQSYEVSKAAEISSRFRTLLVGELEKVDAYCAKVQNDAEERLDEIAATWHEGMSETAQAQWREALSAVIQDFEELLEFTQANVLGFKKITKKFDKNFRCLGNGLPQKAHAHGPVRVSFLESTDPSFSLSTSPTVAVNGFHSFPRSTRRSSMGAEGKLLWQLVISYRFITTMKDETLLNKARELYRKHIPEVSLLENSNKLSSVTIDDSEVRTLQNISLDDIPYGKISKFWLLIGADALQPISIPIIVARGTHPGPTVGLTSALHGNEVNGVRVIHRLFAQELDPTFLHGTVIAVPVINVQGFLNYSREYDGQDLNRLMPGKKDGSAPQQYAYQLMERLVRHFDYLIDLHTASQGRVNSLYVRANMLHQKTRQMATMQNPQIIVHNTSPDGSLRGAAMQLGIPAITVEIGNPSVFQKRFVKNALIGVTNILTSLCVIPHGTNVLPEFDPVICDKSYWIFSSTGGILNVIPEVNTWVRKDQVIATVHSIFGQLVQCYPAPEDSIVIGKEINPVASTGSRIVHLGVVHGKYADKVDDGHQ